MAFLPYNHQMEPDEAPKIPGIVRQMINAGPSYAIIDRVHEGECRYRG
jgi:hypothetical protein